VCIRAQSRSSASVGADGRGVLANDRRQSADSSRRALLLSVQDRPGSHDLAVVPGSAGRLAVTAKPRAGPGHLRVEEAQDTYVEPTRA
jgi:hypothetical protein